MMVSKAFAIFGLSKDSVQNLISCACAVAGALTIATDAARRLSHFPDICSSLSFADDAVSTFFVFSRLVALRGPKVKRQGGAEPCALGALRRRAAARGERSQAVTARGRKQMSGETRAAALAYDAMMILTPARSKACASASASPSSVMKAWIRPSPPSRVNEFRLTLVESATR